jgi:hypothetical protein
VNVTIDEMILLAGGVFLTVWGIGKINERTKLVKTGVKVDGIVFKIEKRLGSGSMDNTRYHPVIRYVTLEDKEWITEEYSIGTNPSMYKEGEAVKIIYDSADNRHFIIDGLANKLTGPVLLIVGVVLIAAVIIYYILHQYPSA